MLLGSCTSPPMPEGAGSSLTSPIVYRAQVSEVPLLADTLQAAFDGYHWTDWAFPADDRAARPRASFTLYLTASIEGLGEVWTTQDHGSVAIWLAPGRGTLADNESRRLDEQVGVLLGKNSGQVATADAAVDAHHQAQPYWLPGHGRHAARMARIRLRRSCVDAGCCSCCDRDGLRAVMDTSTRSNMQLYSRLGFETTAELQPDGGAPRVWVMTRNPRTL